MDQPQVKYYKGVFHSQFLSLPPKDSKVWTNANIQLEQRFVLKIQEEITLEEYESAKAQRLSEESIKWQSEPKNAYSFSPTELKPHVLLEENNFIELVFNNGIASREICTELYVEFGSNELLETHKKNDFKAFKDGRYHGRVTGYGFARIPMLALEEKETISRELFLSEIRNRRGCLTPFLPNTGGIFGFGSRSGIANGCLAFPRSGCGQTGCGFLGLLILLGLLIASWRSCEPSNNIGPRVIRDTVYVDEQSKKDVIKQFLDTTTIFKTEAIELPNVQFYSNSSKLLPYSISSIQQLADYLLSHPNIHAVIEGHTDNIGDPSANLNLSKDRAETVRQVLISLGVESNRIEAKGYGKNHPRADNNTLEGRALNRRVEVRLINTESSDTKSTEIKNDL